MEVGFFPTSRTLEKSKLTRGVEQGGFTKLFQKTRR